MQNRTRRSVVSSIVVLALNVGCSPSEPNELDTLGTTNLTIKDRAFQLWIADDNTERARGLMFVTAEQMAPVSETLDRGMVFVFDHDVIKTADWITIGCNASDDRAPTGKKLSLCKARRHSGDAVRVSSTMRASPIAVDWRHRLANSAAPHRAAFYVVFFYKK